MRKAKVMLISLLSLVFVLSGMSVLAEGTPPQIAEWFKPDGLHHPFEATGTEFVLKDNPIFPNLKIVSSEDVHIRLEAITNTISFHIAPLTATAITETVITISGLEPFWQDKSPQRHRGHKENT
jgi:hypothetical protein